MSLTLRALIADRGHLQRAASRLKGARVAELTESLGLLALTPAVEAALPAAAGGTPFDGLGVSAGLASWAGAASKASPVAFVLADYTAGKNLQAAVVWTAGKVSAGPWKDATAWDPREDARERPVNAALRLLGVSAKGCNDEWDAVGLARHRTTEEWAGA